MTTKSTIRLSHRGSHQKASSEAMKPAPQYQALTRPALASPKP